MNSEGDDQASRILVMTDTDNGDGTMWRAVVMYADGCLAIQGFDTGPHVERIFGAAEYEFARDYTADETRRVRALFELDVDADLLEAIEARFASTAELAAYLLGEGLAGEFATWLR